MQTCTLCKKVEIVPGDYEDYRQLAEYHYRDAGPGQFTKIFAMIISRASCVLRIAKKHNTRYASRNTQYETIGVIVYSNPTPGMELRNIATNNFFVGFDKITQITLLNKYVRRISRVIIEPRFRGLGLAVRLVKETMPLIDVPIIEAVGVMCIVNPFLEKAGMTAYTSSPKIPSARLIAAFKTCGIPESLLIDPSEVQKKIDLLDEEKRAFLEKQLKYFLQSSGSRRYSEPSLKRTRYVLGKLTYRPVYYIKIQKQKGPK